MLFSWLQRKPEARRDWLDGRVPEPLAPPHPRSQDSSDRSPLPVVVIGAGAAGLAAAAVLQQNDVPVVVLEARSDRLGGRIQTLSLTTGDGTLKSGPKPTVDVGAAWVDGVPGNPLYQYIRDSGLETLPDNFKNPLLTLGVYESSTGARLSWYQPILMMFRVFRYFGSCESNTATQFISMKDRIRHELPAARTRSSQLANWFATYMTEMNFAARPELVSPNCWSINPDYDDDESVFVKGGYGKLIELLSSQVEDIRMGQVVTRIDSTNELFISVHVDSGEVFRASHVIVTVPLGVLQADCIAFDPPLSPSKQQAIHCIGFGSFEKTVLRFPKPFWRPKPNRPWSFFFVPECESDDTTEKDPSAFLDLSESAGAWVLVVLETTRPTDRSPDELFQRLERILKRQFPQTYLDPLQIYTTQWQNDPFARGSYSFPGVQTQLRHYKDMERPERNGRVLFAGEATSVEHSGYVGGAVESGVREARRILGFPAPLRPCAASRKSITVRNTRVTMIHAPLSANVGAVIAVVAAVFLWTRPFGRASTNAGAASLGAALRASSGGRDGLM